MKQFVEPTFCSPQRSPTIVRKANFIFWASAFPKPTNQREASCNFPTRLLGGCSLNMHSQLACFYPHPNLHTNTPIDGSRLLYSPTRSAFPSCLENLERSRCQKPEPPCLQACCTGSSTTNGRRPRGAPWTTAAAGRRCTTSPGDSSPGC